MTIRTTLAALAAAAGVVHFYRPQEPLLKPPFEVAALEAVRLPFARPSAEAYGRSGGVKMRFALPRETVRYPLDVAGDRATLAYKWVRVVDSVAQSVLRPLGGAALTAPDQPGFYRLALVRDGDLRLVDDITLTVLVPFAEKRGGILKGYKIGNYVGERLAGAKKLNAGLPDGFFPVLTFALDLPVSEHLKLRDVLTTPHTKARGYPQYATLDPRLIEKLELVMDEVVKLAGPTTVGTPRITVNSGFRSPTYNAEVAGAASRSRHQYGDAADVRIDVNGDGRFTMAEVRLVEKAVRAVERAHPDLAGGLGLYTSARYRSPYIHIDARGSSARWNG